MQGATATRNYGNSYSVDAWGTLTNKTVSKCTAEQLNEPAGFDNRFSTGANRYDADGNMVENGLYIFDAENRLVQVSTTNGYAYDGDGNRNTKGTMFRLCISQCYWVLMPTMLYWLGAGSETLAESDAGGNLTAEYVYFGGARVARLDNPSQPSPTVHYYISDHIGSATVIASASGANERRVALDKGEGVVKGIVILSGARAPLVLCFCERG